MRRKAALLELLAHPITQDAMRSLAQGSDPRGVLAGMAGDLVAQELGKALGTRRIAARAPEPASRPQKAPQPSSSRTTRAPRPKVEQMSEDDIVDAEYTVINVTPRGAKKAG